MKKILLTIVAFAAVLTASAYDYPYLVFTAGDGTEHPMNCQNLTIELLNGQIIVSNGSESKTFELAALTKMCFATDVQAVGSIDVDDTDVVVEAFSLTGISMGCFENVDDVSKTLAPGLYIIKQGSIITKIAVK